MRRIDILVIFWAVHYNMIFLYSKTKTFKFVKIIAVQFIKYLDK